MKSIVNFIKNHGFGIMMVGFAIAIISLIFVMKFQHGYSIEKQVAIGMTITGFCVYVIGRIGVVLHKKATHSGK